MPPDSGFDCTKLAKKKKKNWETGPDTIPQTDIAFPVCGATVSGLRLCGLAGGGPRHPLTYRYTFAHDAVHDAKRGAQIGEPGRVQLAYGLAKLALCNDREREREREEHTLV